MAKAEGTDSTTLPIDTNFSNIELPPLDTLVEWANAHSPMLKQQDALIEKTTEDTKRIKKILLDAIKLNANFQNGNFGDPTANKLLTGYSAGASLQFSLYQIFGYKNQVGVYNAEKKVAYYKREETVMDLRKLVTILYNAVLSQNNILKIRSDGTYAAFTHTKMAEKQFSVGGIEVGELSRVTEIYTKALVEYEVTVNDLKNAYMQLEILVGVPLDSYKKK
jgi:outer membrane protein TolC